MKRPLVFLTLWLPLAAIASDLEQSPGLYAQDGKYLGNLNRNSYDPNSVNNPYGRYGNPYSADSINNPYGRYGNPYSPLSPNNPYGPGVRIVAPRW